MTTVSPEKSPDVKSVTDRTFSQNRKRKGRHGHPFASDSRRGGQRTRNRPAPQLVRMYAIWPGVSTARFAVSAYGRDAAVP